MEMRSQLHSLAVYDRAKLRYPFRRKLDGFWRREKNLAYPGIGALDRAACS
jgi:hypothetical protein